MKFHRPISLSPPTNLHCRAAAPPPTASSTANRLPQFSLTWAKCWCFLRQERRGGNWPTIQVALFTCILEGSLRLAFPSALPRKDQVWSFPSSPPQNFKWYEALGISLFRRPDRSGQLELPKVQASHSHPHVLLKPLLWTVPCILLHPFCLVPFYSTTLECWFYPSKWISWTTHGHDLQLKHTGLNWPKYSITRIFTKSQLIRKPHNKQLLSQL